MVERDIERWLGAEMKRAGCLYYKFVSPGNSGVPDRIIIVPGGRVIFAELKTCAGRLARVQGLQIERMRACGADVRTIYGMDEAKEFAREVMPK